MKNTFKNISLFALGIVAVATLTSVRLTPALTSATPKTVTLTMVSVPSALLVTLGGDDGQESHGDKGKTKGG